MNDDARAALLRWYDAHARELPWRGLDDPYAILVCEVMSQQTRIDVVVAYWTRWMAAFPTIGELAAADESAVMQLWAGLGYYRRARNLLACARVVAERHGGELPRTAAELAALPGIGAYTSAAIASIAFGEAVAAVDGNVSRVVARLLANGDVPTTAAFRRAIDTAAAQLVDPTRPGASNEALMELGATVCGRTPSCSRCPLSPWCLARHSADPARYPAPKPRKAPRRERRVTVVPLRDGAVFMRLGDRELLGGLWEFPTYVADRGAAVAALEEQHGIGGEAAALGEVEWTFSHIRMTYDVLRLAPARGEGRGGEWVPVAELPERALSSAMRSVASIAGPLLEP